jgi:hypothetical protein
MEAPFGEALDAVVSVRALSSTLRGIAQEFAKLEDVAVTGTNGLSVWVKAGLAVVSYHPDIGKLFAGEINKLK